MASSSSSQQVLGQVSMFVFATPMNLLSNDKILHSYKASQTPFKLHKPLDSQRVLGTVMGDIFPIHNREV